MASSFVGLRVLKLLPGKMRQASPEPPGAGRGKGTEAGRSRTPLDPLRDAGQLENRWTRRT